MPLKSSTSDFRDEDAKKIIACATGILANRSENYEISLKAWADVRRWDISITLDRQEVWRTSADWMDDLSADMICRRMEKELRALVV